MPINRLVVAGNLVADPNLRDVGENKVCSFRIAHNAYRKGEKETYFFNVSAWGRLGETCHEHLAKGRQVVVDGNLSVRTFEKDGEERQSIDIRATDVMFIGPREDKAAAEASTPASAGTTGDGDIPF